MAACLVAISMVSGCGGSNHSQPAAGGTVPPGQALSPDLQQVLSEVAQLRGLPVPEGLSAASLTRAQIPTLLDQELTADDRQYMSDQTVLYQLLGLLNAQQDYRQLYEGFFQSQLVGLYSPARKALYVVAGGSGVEFQALSAQERGAVAHELTHAVQDGAFDLSKTLKTSAADLDWALALSCVIEGDAVGIQGLWSQAHPGGGTGGGGGSSTSAGVPAALEREWRFPYEAGAEWVAITRQQGNAPIDAVLRGEPITTAEILHPGRFAGAPPQEVRLPDLSNALGGGWKREAGGSFGEFELRNYLQLAIPALTAVQAADGWDGDHYDLYQHGNDAVAVFRIAFSSEGEAKEFVAAQDAWFASRKAAVSAANSTVAVLDDGRTVVRPAFSGAQVTFFIATKQQIAEKAADAVTHG
jgi:hypothetical protein